ncbi:MAG: 16S rRNA (adenine(1518)-N(6)/adenine(1519)-N(6))-dimethyltransferase RsmA [Eubacteriales bacterium]|nr:16S rRNA (adenine(1518)-N(6)/adenine(1519)-N(6))-dimethyltransferase RsmA [Eubacteriales bacterium]
MHDLIEAQNTIQFLKEHGISAKKRYGQNFLIDRRVLERIIEGADISENDVVLEIGPGIGTLTQALCKSAGRVIAVEIDRDMIPLLEENLADFDNYEIINDDVLRVDLEAVLKERGLEGRPIKVAANLPYYITTPIIMQLLESGIPAKSITVMVQKEVADRMQALPGTSDYGALSLAVQFYAEAKITAKVPPNSFIPRPGVDSAVITLNCYSEPPVSVKDEKHMFRLIKAAFAQRRKTLANALKNDSSLGLTREKVEAALDSLGLAADIRGERLSLAQFAQLSDIL